MIAAEVPRSLKIPANPIKTIDAPIKPKSLGSNNLARIVVVISCNTCLLYCEKDDHLKPEMTNEDTFITIIFN